MKPFKESLSLVIEDGKDRFLVVKRPNEPSDELSGLWGFPAVTLKPGETHQTAASRVGQQKLGVEIELGKKLGDSTHDRGSYTLHLTDYNAKIANGKPSVPQADESVTQYIDCQYAKDPAVLIPAALKGSQCTQLFLESRGIDWRNYSA